jgi:glucosylceramidase
VKIFAFDDHQRLLLQNWTETIYSNELASRYVDGVAFHWYDGDAFDIVTQLHHSFPEAMMLSSEVSYEKWRWSNATTLEAGDWSFGEGYAHDIIGNLNAGAIGWKDWNLVLDKNGGPNHLNNECDAAMMADVDAQRLYIHPQYYYVGHFSKFILPGSKRIPTNVKGSIPHVDPKRPYGTCTADDGLQAVAFERPDKRVAVVVLNCGGKSMNFKLKDGTCAIRASVPAHGIQTYLFERHGSRGEEVMYM